MSFLETLCEMLVILFGISMGYVANRMGILGKGIDQNLSKLILNITVPCLIVGAVCSGDDLPEPKTVFALLGVALLYYGVQLAVAMAVAPLLGKTVGQKGAVRYALTFSNAAFIGYPVVIALFGQGALFYAVMLTLPANLMAYTLGPLLVGGVRRFSWKQMLSPSVVAAMIGLAVTFLRIRPPALIGEMLNLVGSITTPLSLLVVGSLLAGLSAAKMITAGRLWGMTALRLLALPAALWGLFTLLNVDKLIINVAITLAAMPLAINGVMLCMEYDGDTEYMTAGIFLSTMASIFTIPLVVTWFL